MRHTRLHPRRIPSLEARGEEGGRDEGGEEEGEWHSNEITEISHDEQRESSLFV